MLALEIQNAPGDLAIHPAIVRPWQEIVLATPADCGSGFEGRSIIAAALVRDLNTQAALTDALGGAPPNHTPIELQVRRAEMDMLALEAMQGDVLIIDIDARRRQELDVLAKFVAEHKSVPVVVTSRWLDVNSMRELMRIGVRDVVPQPIKQLDLVSAIRQAMIHPQEDPADPVKGRVVSCIGSCGGAGRTSVAVHAAAALAQRKVVRDVCLIDLDIQFGGMAQLLDAAARCSVLDLVQNLVRLDGALLRSAVVPTVRPGVDLLAAPAALSSVEEIDPNAISALIEQARGEYDMTILDVPMLWSYWTHAALRSSDAIFLIVQPTVSSLRQARRQLEILRQEGLDDKPLVLILNRTESGWLRAGRITIKDAEAVLSRKVDYVIPESPAVRTAAESGRPLGELHGGRAIENKIVEPFENVLEPLKTSASR